MISLVNGRLYFSVFINDLFLFLETTTFYNYAAVKIAAIYEVEIPLPRIIHVTNFYQIILFTFESLRLFITTTLKKVVLKNFAIFTGKHLCWSLGVLEFSQLFNDKIKTWHCDDRCQCQICSRYPVRFFCLLHSRHVAKLHRCFLSMAWVPFFVQNNIRVDFVFARIY